MNMGPTISLFAWSDAGAICCDGCDSPIPLAIRMGGLRIQGDSGRHFELLRGSLKVRNKELLHPLIDTLPIACLTRRV